MVFKKASPFSGLKDDQDFVIAFDYLSATKKVCHPEERRIFFDNTNCILDASLRSA